MRRLIIFLAVFLSGGFSLLGNNLNITNVALVNDSTLRFTIGWDNSWNLPTTPPYNYDAVWIFIKYRDCAGGEWFHAKVKTSASAFTVGSPLAVEFGAIADGNGFFLRRTDTAFGNISNVVVQVPLVGMPPGSFDFKVFGIEMVKIPTDSFYLGDGISTYSYRTGNTANPYYVTHDNAHNVANSGSNLYAGGYPPTGNIPAAFPMGYTGFYVMKYELTQGQYADFLNCLRSDQAAARAYTGNTNRHTITGVWPTYTASAPHRAKNWITTEDLFAYLDWACLRPMSEMEYEKAARGPLNPVAGEYAWGTTLITDGNTLINDGTPTETVTQVPPPGSGLTNYNNNSVLGPIRVGFAAKPGTNRVNAGAGYYGVMDLTGNVWDICVIPRGAGLNFAWNAVGDGYLTTTPNPGDPNVATWPAANGTVIARGGGWNNNAADCRLSQRRLFPGFLTRYREGGGRGVRP